MRFPSVIAALLFLQRVSAWSPPLRSSFGLRLAQRPDQRPTLNFEGAHPTQNPSREIAKRAGAKRVTAAVAAFASSLPLAASAADPSSAALSTTPGTGLTVLRIDVGSMVVTTIARILNNEIIKHFFMKVIDVGIPTVGAVLVLMFIGQELKEDKSSVFDKILKDYKKKPQEESFFIEVRKVLATFHSLLSLTPSGLVETGEAVERPLRCCGRCL